MKKQILTIAIILSLILPVAAGPFVSIVGIDAKSDFPAVKITVSVVDPCYKGIEGLEESNFLVYEDEYRVNYVRVKDVSSVDEYFYFVFSIDSSKSISRDFLARIKFNAEKIADNLTEKDRIAVYRFNDQVKLLNNFTSNKGQVAKSIKSVSRHGSKTLLYNAIYDSMEMLGRVKSNRRGVVVFTDGKDEGSSIHPDDIIKKGRELGIPVYFLTVKGERDLSHLARLAKITGGRLLYSENSDVAGLYKILRSRMKNIYEINYQSIVKRDRKKHNVEVRLKHGDLVDSDKGEFTAERDFLNFEFPDYVYLTWGGLILLFLLLFAFLGFLLMRKSRDEFLVSVEKNPETPSPPSDYNYSYGMENFIERDELFRDDHLVQASDVKYNQAWLQRRDSCKIGGKILISEDEVIIGSGFGSHLILADDMVSFRHSRIKNISGCFFLYDLISDTGTYLNGKKVLRPRLLHDWDEIRIGRETFTFRGINL